MTGRERRTLPAGWNEARPEHLPRPTAYPALFAFGVTLLAWGLVSSFLLVAIGGAVLFYALLHWIGEMRHDGT
jgi:hypothetical protein